MKRQVGFPFVSEALALLCLALALLNGCAHALTVAPGYTVNEIPYSGGRFAWIDSETVLFIGARNHPTDPRAVVGPTALHRWNVKTGEVSAIMDVGEAADVCYDRGYLYVAFNRGDDRVIRQGPIERQEEIVFKRRTESPFKGHFNRYNCRFREIPRATRPDYGVDTVLRDDHGFIEAERPSEPFPQRKYFLVRPPDQRIQISLPCGAGGPRYSEFRHAYVYQDGRGFSSRNIERRVCVVGIDGTVANYTLPKGDWLQGTVYGMPMQGALLMISLSTVEGAYLVRGDSVEKIVKGYVNSFAVSPDGCTVALNINPKNGDGARDAALNVCKGGA